MWFFFCHAGKATMGVSIAALLLAWPPAISWLTAAALLWWSVRHLQAAFRALETPAAPVVTVTATQPGTGIEPSSNGGEVKAWKPSSSLRSVSRFSPMPPNSGARPSGRVSS